MKRLIAMILTVVLALGALTGCGGGGGGSGFLGSSGRVYDAPLKLYVKMLDGSMTQKDLKRLLPEESWEILTENENMSREELWEQLEPMLAMIWVALERTYGEGYRVSCRVTDEERIDEEDDRWPAVEEIGLDPDGLTKAYALELEITVKGSKEEQTVDGDGVAFCYEGVWYATLNLEEVGTLVAPGVDFGTTSQEAPAVTDRESSDKPTVAECQELMDCWVRLYTGKADEDDVERMFPADFWEYAEDEMDMDVASAVEYLWIQAGEAKERLKDTFGSNAKITYEILDREACDEDTLEELQEDGTEIGLKARKMTGGCYVELEITVKGLLDKQTFDVEAMLYRYDGQWYCKDLDLDELNDYMDS